MQTPVKVDYGVQSYPFVGESVKRWQSINPLVSSEKVPGSHCFMQQDPAAAAARVKAFLLGA